MYNNIVEEKGKGDNMTKKKYEPNIKLAQLENQIKKATDQEELENLQLGQYITLGLWSI